MAASHRHSWASQLQAEDADQRCEGGYVAARVVDSLKNNACCLENQHVDGLRGGRTQQEQQLSMGEDLSEEEMDADCALSSAQNNLPEAKYNLTDPVALANFLEEADIRLIRAKYLGPLVLSKQPLQRRQELESATFTTSEGDVESALVTHEEVQSWAAGRREAIICSISHAWETREHPDPCRYQLQHVVNWTSLCEAAFYADVWVFYDYASLFQYERFSVREESSFRAAMQNMHVLYAHECSLTLRIESLTPYDVWERMKLSKAELVPVYDLNEKRVIGKPLQSLVENRNLYVDRGWCRAEIEWSSLRSVNAQHQRIDNSGSNSENSSDQVGSDGLNSHSDEPDSDQVRSADLNGRVPTPPAEFERQMKTAAFTHRSDAGSVIHLQSKIFHEKVTVCEELVLQGLPASQIWALARGLPNYKSLKSIKVITFRCGEAEAKAFGEALAQSQVECLEFSGASDGSSGDFMAKALAEALKINTSVREINLRGNRIGNQGAKALFEVLKINTSVRKINLEMNPIGYSVAEAVQSLQRNREAAMGLEKERIQEDSKNKHQASGRRPFEAQVRIKALAKALEKDYGVQKIYLGDNDIGNRVAEALAEALKINTSVRKIFLYCNPIDDRGAEALAEALKINTSVQLIGLPKNKIGDKGAEALAEALKINTSVQKIQLESNGIGDRGAEALAEAKKINRSVLISR